MGQAVAQDKNNLPIDLEEEQGRSVFPYQETPDNQSWASSLPLKQGLYDPANEKDACGVGFAA